MVPLNFISSKLGTRYPLKLIISTHYLTNLLQYLPTPFFLPLFHAKNSLSTPSFNSWPKFSRYGSTKPYILLINVDIWYVNTKLHLYSFILLQEIYLLFLSFFMISQHQEIHQTFKIKT